MMSDRRRSPRFEVQDVRGVLHVHSSARLRALAAGEATVEATLPLRVGGVYDLTVRLTAGTLATLTASVVSCELVERQRSLPGSAPVYKAQMRIDSQLPVEVAGAAAGPLSAVEPGARLETVQPFSALTLSFHGALIEVDRPFLAGMIMDAEIHLGDETLHTRVRVAFCHEQSGKAGTTYRAGVELMRTPGVDLAPLDDFLALQAGSLQT